MSSLITLRGGDGSDGDYAAVDDWQQQQQQQQRRRCCRRVVVGAVACAVVLALVVAAAVGIVVVTRGGGGAGGRTRTTVVLVSIDAFRWDYLDREEVAMPNIRSLINNGVRAEYLASAFPSKTFPNHYTLVTGLLPAYHGIIANVMYDPVWDAWFRVGSNGSLDGRWWGGEPLWVTAQKQGLRVGVFYWPGSEAEIDGMRPTYWEVYNQSTPYDTRVDTVLGWLSLPEEQRPSLVLMYFEGVDSMGHAYGPDSVQVNAAIEEVDVAIGRLLTGLKQIDFPEEPNVVVLSDHGMTAISTERVIDVSKCIDLSDGTVVDWSPVFALRPNNVTTAMQGLRNCHPNLTAYLREDLPDRYYYEDNRRITPVVAVADLGWTVTRSSQVVATANSLDDKRWWLHEDGRAVVTGGAHGYDPIYPDMRGILIGSGPGLKNHTKFEAVANTDVSVFICNLLGLEPPVCNGTNAIANCALKERL
eukprot:TRINITY_DN1638_c0_g1_i20.p1 TRINITY_DN1638_c0_g1~~TRINITY_DN1638_c0_g1_i20.p1  ORF type:complete len:497 (+),score=75.57 TRINITY_DN1638_c0_g1_i20:73-1491(+)